MNVKVPSPTIGTIESLDPIWTRLRKEAEAVVANEPALASFVYTYILNHERLEDAVAHRIADRLDSAHFDGDLINRAFGEMLAADNSYRVALRADLVAVHDRDPACTRFLEPVLYFKGFHAIQAHRLAHWLLGNERRDFAFYLQSQASEVFQVDINPAVPMGRSVARSYMAKPVWSEPPLLKRSYTASMPSGVSGRAGSPVSSDNSRSFSHFQSSGINPRWAGPSATSSPTSTSGEAIPTSGGVQSAVIRSATCWPGT